MIIQYSDGATNNVGIVQGADGTDGMDGAHGQDGNDGIDGKDGRDGQDGSHGLDGQDGIDGTDGQDGTDGRSIISTTLSGGALIIQYSDGAANNVGIVQGADGTDGVDGTHGQDGKDGRDGKDGVGVEAIEPYDSGLRITLTNGETTYIPLSADEKEVEEPLTVTFVSTDGTILEKQTVGDKAIAVPAYDPGGFWTWEDIPKTITEPITIAAIAHDAMTLEDLDYSHHTNEITVRAEVSGVSQDYVYVRDAWGHAALAMDAGTITTGDTVFIEGTDVSYNHMEGPYGLIESVSLVNHLQSDEQPTGVTFEDKEALNAYLDAHPFTIHGLYSFPELPITSSSDNTVSTEVSGFTITFDKPTLEASGATIKSTIPPVSVIMNPAMFGDWEALPQALNE